MNSDGSRVIKGSALESSLGRAGVVVIDVGKPDLYSRAHLPGASFLGYGHLVRKQGLTGGLMPPVEHLTNLFSDLGIGQDDRVVAYDEEGGGKAARLCWTLDCLGHHIWSLLDGGIHAWIAEKRPLTQEKPNPSRKNFVYSPNSKCSADADYILSRLDEEGTSLIDARSIEEYQGKQRFARRAGHIPGARHWEWTSALDQTRHYRFRPAEELMAELTARNVSSEQEVICYCQTHHRSSLSYVVLKYLGFENVRGYPGSWSEWGNRLDTPVE